MAGVGLLSRANKTCHPGVVATKFGSIPDLPPGVTAQAWMCGEASSPSGGIEVQLP